MMSFNFSNFHLSFITVWILILKINVIIKKISLSERIIHVIINVINNGKIK